MYYCINPVRALHSSPCRPCITALTHSSCITGYYVHVADLPEVGGVVDLLAAEQLPHQLHDVGLEVALVQHGIQHAGAERLAGRKLWLEEVGEVVPSLALQGDQENRDRRIGTGEQENRDRRIGTGE